MNVRNRGPRFALLLLALTATTCFTGDGLVDQPCRSDDDCNPRADVLGQTLRCVHNVCGYNARCGDGIVDEIEECDLGPDNIKSDRGMQSGECSAIECRYLP
ncbi:hypothetical protein [Nannocystis sp.]|uniref:hypothetical protein n=1 Tax=Nannocystis sp. TaxID=1962667 RepID=UPI0025F3914C|nr:hypothetical protein [Nannocystis sp.]MBK7823639.1 hypothetical protein [Nannocystis sp.]